MSFITYNEYMHFLFDEAHVGNLQITEDMFHLVLDNVKILPENSCNRDIRLMRCNELLFKLKNPNIQSVVREGYKEYDADNNLRQTVPDEIINPEDYPKVWEVLLDGEFFALKKEGNQYDMSIDATDDRTYTIVVQGDGDSEEWERFLNL